MSIAIATVAYGPTYLGFLPAWAQAVNALTTQPDTIIILTDDPAQAREHTTGMDPHIVPITGSHKHHPHKHLTPVLRQVDADWICKMDVDDRIRPHALDHLSLSDADVVMFGIQFGPHALYAKPVQAHHILNIPENLVFSGSPYRKWLLSEAVYRDMIYEDWAFWIDCAKQGARFQPSGTIDYDYIAHDHNISTNVNDNYWRSIVLSGQGL